MNIFTIFFHKILAKYSPKRTIFKNFLGGACPRTPLANARHANTPTFPKNILNPPPPRNEILDTPLLHVHDIINTNKKSSCT